MTASLYRPFLVGNSCFIFPFTVSVARSPALPIGRRLITLRLYASIWRKLFPKLHFRQSYEKTLG